MFQDIQQHGENLNKIFNTGIDPVKLCKKLRSLEIKAHRLATDYCNGENGINSENWDAKCKPILNQVCKILNPINADVEIFLNGDARGYALKIRFDDSDARSREMHTDWGGYGILAPDYSPSNN